MRMETDIRTVHIPVSLSDGNRAATVSLARAPWEPQSSQVTHERQAEIVRREKAGLR